MPCLFLARPYKAPDRINQDADDYGYAYSYQYHALQAMARGSVRRRSIRCPNLGKTKSKDNGYKWHLFSHR